MFVTANVIRWFRHAALAALASVQEEIAATLFRLHNAARQLQTPEAAERCLQRLLTVEKDISERCKSTYHAVESSAPGHGDNRSPPSATSSQLQPVGPFSGQHRKRSHATKITGTCAKQGRTREGILVELVAAQRVTAVLSEHGYAIPSAVVQRQHALSQATSTATSPARPPPNAKQTGTVRNTTTSLRNCLFSIVAFYPCVPFLLSQ